MGRPPRITEEQLFETARRVFASKGFEATTLADIGNELGVSPAALLRHVRSKQELFDTAMSRRVSEPPDFILELATVDASADPQIVLRRIAERFIPFVEKVIGENIAVYMHDRARPLVMPFDPRAADSPPRRGMVLVIEYFRRAMDAGTIRRGDPRAAALMFMGSLQGYVMMHHVVHALPRRYPLNRYIDALLDLWSRGAIAQPRRGKKKRKSR